MGNIPLTLGCNHALLRGGLMEGQKLVRTWCWLRRWQWLAAWGRTAKDKFVLNSYQTDARKGWKHGYKRSPWNFSVVKINNLENFSRYVKVCLFS